MKKDIEDKNSIENSTLNQKINKNIQLSRWCFNDTKEKKEIKLNIPKTLK